VGAKRVIVSEGMVEVELKESLEGGASNIVGGLRG
jgi:hypothetical protein